MSVISAFICVYVRPVCFFSALAISSVTLAQDKPARRPWRIKGQFTEACTCNVPCPCNFGERPSPYDYCYTMWSYWVQDGNWEKVRINDLRIGGVDGPVGIMGLLDVRADAAQRPRRVTLFRRSKCPRCGPLEMPGTYRL